MTEYKIYLDSDVLISLFRTEINGAFNLRFQDTQAFLTLCAERGIKIVLSDELFREVKQVTGLDKEDALKLMDESGVVVETIHGAKTTDKTVRAVKERTGIHTSDALHVSCALESGCSVIVSWNKRDFEKTRSFIACADPKEFVSDFGDTPQPNGPSVPS